MNKPIALAVRDLKTQIIGAINDSQLPPCVVEPILAVIHQQITAAAKTEITQAEIQLAESEVSE